MLTPEGHAMVETAVLEPGDALFIPIGYFHTVASAVGLTSQDDLAVRRRTRLTSPPTLARTHARTPPCLPAVYRMCTCPSVCTPVRATVARP